MPTPYELLSAPGEHLVDAPITCAMTRFRLRSSRYLAASYRDYRNIIRSVDDPASLGLLRSAFLVENPSTWYSYSVWDGTPELSAHVRAHIDAANRVLGRLAMHPDRGVELWSTKWRLTSVSNNLHWGDFDMRRLIADQDR
jgi:hypothetical protein